MRFLGFLIKRKFYLHFGISIIITLILFFFIFKFLKTYTNHEEIYTVPDFYGKTIEEIKEDKSNEIFEFIVIDSLYDPRNKKESIVIQNPPAGSKVKRHRKIYVTTVAKMPEKVEMPNLIDLSLRQAINLLHAKGLMVNNLEYVTDFAENAVLEQIFENEIIEPGAIIEKGSVIDLILGLGDNKKVPVPFLIGLKYNEALYAIYRASFNIGSVYFLDGNSMQHNRVYKQGPAWNEHASLFRGQHVSVWFRSDENFDFDALIKKYQPDTTSINISQ